MNRLTALRITMGLAGALTTACGSDPVHPTSPPTSHNVVVTWEHPFPPAAVNCLAGFARDDIYAVGGGGMILHYDGRNWSTVNSPTRASLSGLWAPARDNIVAVGYNGAIIRFDGHDWNTEESGTTNPLSAVWGSAPDTVYAVGYPGVVLRNDGHAWTAIPGPPSLQLMRIWGTDGANMYVGATDSLYHFDGATWTNTGIYVRDSVWGIWGSSRNDVWVTDGTNWPWHYDGSKWANLYPYVNYPFTNFWGLGPDDLYGVGTDGFVAHYDGTSWSSQNLGDYFLRTQWGTAHDDIWVGGFPQRGFGGGTLFHYDGVDWTPSGEFLGSGLRDIWSNRNGSRAIAVSVYGRILRKENNTWRSDGDVTTQQLNAVWGAPTGEAFAVGNAGTCLKFNGQSWVPVTIGTPASLYDVWGSSSSDLYVGGENDLWHFDGSNWMPAGFHHLVNSVWGTGQSNVYACGIDSLFEKAVIQHFDGSSWTDMPTGSTKWVSSLTGYSNGAVFARFHDDVEQRDFIKEYRGGSWEDISPPQFSQLGPFAASDDFGLVVVGSNLVGGGALLDRMVLRFSAGEWTRMDTKYQTYFQSIWGGLDGGVYLVGDAAIVRCHY
ncbi:MAG TPA: hypothetical protein VFH88_09365 [Candidatus Krumholzibacteria bacterium]|nr:hypothetical protein [Candidatus Krumholzibacteria bacterium]